MSGAVESFRFHLRYAWFNIKEQFSDLAAGIAGFVLFPFYIWMLGRLWERFNSYQGNYTLKEVMLYVGMTEILFMTFLRPASLARASGDFSLALARPRSWLVTSFSGLAGRSFGSRIIYLVIFVIVAPFLGLEMENVSAAALRLILLLPLLGLAQGLIALLFASAQVRWHETTYFLLPVSKIFLALGGVFCPLVDFGEPWRSVFLKLPAADLFFQVGHFCVKGSFFEMSMIYWLSRISALCVALLAANYFFHQYSRKHHQSYGG